MVPYFVHSQAIFIFLRTQVRILVLFLTHLVGGSNPPRIIPGLRPFALAGGRFVGRGYLAMVIYPLTMAGLVPLPKQFSQLNQSTYVFGRGYLVMAIYPLTMAGLVPLPKQFSHVNQ